MSERLTPEQRADMREDYEQRSAKGADYARPWLQALDELDALEKERDAWRKATESLTPGGSEFFNDPQRCADHIRQRTNWPRQIVELKAERDSLRAQLESLSAFCREATALAMEVVWGGKPGECETPENIYTAGIGGIRQAFDMARAQLEKSQRDLAAETKMRKEAEEAADFEANLVDREKVALRARCEQLETTLAQYRWRPISEIHEDYGECVLMNLNDPGRLELGNNCSHGFIADDWTHFAEVPKLTIEEAEVLAAESTPKV